MSVSKLRKKHFTQDLDKLEDSSIASNPPDILVKEKTESEIKNDFLIKLLNKINEDKIEEVIKDNTIYISEDIKIDSEDEEQVSYIKSIYKKSLSNYHLVEGYSKKIRDENFLNTVKELQLITQNILLKFNEKPFSVPKHSMFVDYYQERFARFVGDFVKISTDTIVKDEKVINDIKTVVTGLKDIFVTEYNSISKADMLDLAVEIDLMQKNINEYTRNIEKETLNAPLKTNIDVSYKPIISTKDVALKKTNSIVVEEQQESNGYIYFGIGAMTTLALLHYFL